MQSPRKPSTPSSLCPLKTRCDLHVPFWKGPVARSPAAVSLAQTPACRPLEGRGRVWILNQPHAECGSPGPCQHCHSFLRSRWQGITGPGPHGSQVVDKKPRWRHGCGSALLGACKSLSLLRLLAVWWHQSTTLPVAILILSPWWLPHKGSGVWLRSVCRDGISQLSQHLPGPGSVLLADVSVVRVRRWRL